MMTPSQPRSANPSLGQPLRGASRATITAGRAPNTSTSQKSVRATSPFMIAPPCSVAVTVILRRRVAGTKTNRRPRDCQFQPRSLARFFRHCRGPQTLGRGVTFSRWKPGLTGRRRGGRLRPLLLRLGRARSRPPGEPLGSVSRRRQAAGAGCLRRSGQNAFFVQKPGRGTGASRHEVGGSMS